LAGGALVGAAGLGVQQRPFIGGPMGGIPLGIGGIAFAGAFGAIGGAFMGGAFGAGAFFLAGMLGCGSVWLRRGHLAFRESGIPTLSLIVSLIPPWISGVRFDRRPHPRLRIGKYSPLVPRLRGVGLVEVPAGHVP